MSCCFEDTLHYSSPAHGDRGVVRAGMLVPESVQLFVCPFACGRHGAIGAATAHLKHRLFYLYLEQSDIITGYDDLIPPAVEEVLEVLSTPPKVFFIFVSCLDDLIGTDHEALLETLRAQFPDICFRICHMNPISLGTATPPPVSIQNSIYSLLEEGRPRDTGVNCLGNMENILPDSEIFAFLRSIGCKGLRHITDYQTFDDYQEMAGSRLNLVLTPTGKQAADLIEEKLGTPYLFIPVSYRFKEIEETYQKIAEALGVEHPDFDFTPCRQAAEAAVKHARETLGSIPLVVNSSACFRPFEMARALLEFGFNVVRVQAQECIPVDQPHFDWVQKHHPEVEVIQSQHHRVVCFDKKLPESLAVGIDGAYLADSKYAADILIDEGMFGYHGVKTVMERLEKAMDSPIDLKKMINDYGLVV